MGLNVSTSMGLENKEILKNTAKNILSGSGVSSEKNSQIINSSIFGSDNSYVNSQLSILKASTQISINNTLNETLKYLKTHANQKPAVKTPVLGELWNIIASTNEESEKNPYRGELYDFKIDKSAKNIFAA